MLGCPGVACARPPWPWPEPEKAPGAGQFSVAEVAILSWGGGHEVELGKTLYNLFRSNQKYFLKSLDEFYVGANVGLLRTFE